MQSSQDRPQYYSDMAITTILLLKRVFHLTLRVVQGFVELIIFWLIGSTG
ncbi:transposase [Citrobacter freundii]|nr:transposase [Citrobacter freundii]